jgi:SAM-dependent methyltransferase
MNYNEHADAPWYVRSFGELYPLIYRHRDDEAAAREIDALLAALGLTGTKRVLDLCCGAGRHAAALQGRGLDVVGLDLSPQLLAEARERPGLAGRLVRADMRRLPFADGAPDAGFDLVVNLFTSFGYFARDDENAVALGEMARVLRPGGTLVVDHINRSLLERTLVAENDEERRGFRIRYKRRIEGDRAHKEIAVRDESGRVTVFNESVRLFGSHELEELCAAAGLCCRRIMGSFGGEPFVTDSGRMIVVAAKPEGREA